MNTTIFLATVGSALLLVGIIYSVKAWNTRPILTPEQNAKRISDGIAPFTYPMALSGVGVVTGLFVLAMALLPLVLK